MTKTLKREREAEKEGGEEEKVGQENFPFVNAL